MTKVFREGEFIQKKDGTGEVFEVMSVAAKYYHVEERLTRTIYTFHRLSVNASYHVVAMKPLVVKPGRVLLGEEKKFFQVGDIITQKESDLPREYQITHVGEGYYGAFAVDTGRGADLRRPLTDESYRYVRHVDQGQPKRKRKTVRGIDL